MFTPYLDYAINPFKHADPTVPFPLPRHNRSAR